MGMKSWTAAFLWQCKVSRKHRPAMTQRASDNLKYRACRHQTSFVSQINPKASNPAVL